MSTATDGLTSRPLSATAPSALARVSEDPDAPIRTGRWDTPPSGPVQLAGAAPDPAAAAPTDHPITVAVLAPPATPRPGAIRALPAPVLARAAFRPDRAPPELLGGPRVRLSVSSDRDALAPGAGLDVEDRFTGESSFAARPPPRASQPFDGKRLLLSIAPQASDRKKGRWFIFAAGSGEAFGLNVIRDPARGWRRAGWSVERLAEFGKAQLGVGWRRDNRQVAFSAARREIGAYGYKREDTVLGVTFTVSGKPGQKVKREQSLPKP